MNSSPQGGKQLGRQGGAGSGVAHQGGGYRGLHGFMKRISFRGFQAGQAPRPSEEPGASYAGRGVLDKTVFLFSIHAARGAVNANSHAGN